MLLFAVTHIWQSMQSEISHQDFHRSLTAEYSEAVQKKRVQLSKSGSQGVLLQAATVC